MKEFFKKPIVIILLILLTVGIFYYYSKKIKTEKVNKKLGKSVHDKNTGVTTITPYVKETTQSTNIGTVITADPVTTVSSDGDSDEPITVISVVANLSSEDTGGVTSL